MDQVRSWKRENGLSLDIAWFKGSERVNSFDVLVSNDGSTLRKFSPVRAVAQLLPQKNKMFLIQKGGMYG